MLNKTQVIKMIATQNGLTLKAAESVVNSFLDIIEKALKNGDTVLFTGFGKFEVRSKKERTGRNPQTGAKITIPATKSPAFRAGKALKSAVK